MPPSSAHTLDRDPRLQRWTALARDASSRRLTRVIAPAGYHKSAFAHHLHSTAPGEAVHVTFRYAHSTLRGALQLVVDALGLDPNIFELPNLLQHSGKISPSQLARAIRQDMSHERLAGITLILDDVHLLDREAAAVLVQIATADPYRLHVVACVRHVDDFPARELWSVPSLDITDVDLAYTPDELQTFGPEHNDPYGYPALALSVRQGLTPQVHMRRMLSMIEEDLLAELSRAVLIPIWPLTASQAAALGVRPLLVQDALAADLPIIRPDPTREHYVPHPALADALHQVLAEHPEQARDAHARLVTHNAATDPVLAVRHARLAQDTTRAAAIATEWLTRTDAEAASIADDLVLELVPFESSLPGRLRLRVAGALAHRGRSAEAIVILNALRHPSPHVKPADDDASTEDVALALARIYAMTGAYARAFEELRVAANTSTTPFTRAFAAYLLVTMHARGGEEVSGTHGSTLETAHEWSKWALQEIKRHGPTYRGDADAELMALCVQTYLGHWSERGMSRIHSQLNILMLQEAFDTPEAGHALLLLHRLLTDHGQPDLAARTLESAQRLLTVSLDARAALLNAEGRAHLRQGRTEEAIGILLLAEQALNPEATDRALHAEVRLLILCAVLCLPHVPMSDVWEAYKQYAQTVAFLASPQHEQNKQALMDLCLRRESLRGRGSQKLGTLNQQLRVQLPALLNHRCEAAPLVLMTLVPYDTKDRDLALERGWQIQQAVRSVGRATVEAYREALAPEYAMLRSADLHVRVIGTPLIEVDGIPLKITPKQTLLIVLLAVTRGHYTRKELADLLYEGSDSTLGVAISRLYQTLRQAGISDDLIGQLPSSNPRGVLHTVRHHRVTLDLDTFGPHNPEAFWRALGPRGLENLFSGLDHEWVDEQRQQWAERCLRPAQP